MKINFEYSSVYDMMLNEVMGNTNFEKPKEFIDSVKIFWRLNIETCLYLGIWLLKFLWLN